MKFGDRVAYSRKFLKSVGAYTGALPFARGTVKAIEEVGSMTLARIHWDISEGVPERVNVANLVLVEDIPFEER